MDVVKLIELNELWKPVYPFLASQIWKSAPANAREILEIGPFSGGVSFEITKFKPEVSATLAIDEPEVMAYLTQCIRDMGLDRKIAVVQSPLNPLALDDDMFDLAVLRGAFFFLDEAILREVFRVLKPGGVAWVGGGYGAETPSSIIEKIGDTSRRLNYELGKKWLSRNEVELLIGKAGLEEKCQITEEGGLWIILRK